MARDYSKERKYDAQPEVMAKRAARNRARYTALKLGIVKVGDKLDINHKNGRALDTTSGSMRNLEAIPAAKNRSYPRTSSAGKKNPKD